MHRLLVDSASLGDDSPALPREAARHLRVLRLGRGESVELFDGKGSARTYGWNGAALSALGGIRTSPRPASSLTLFACITKGSRWDWTVEKATELGATRIVPVISARTIVRIPKGERTAKRARWLRIAEDAARQSDAIWLPEICEAVDFTDSLAMVRETDCFVGALTEPEPPPIAVAMREHLDRAADPVGISVYVGPEGDFTPGELSSLLEIATPTSFGPTILRAETAAIFAVSVAAAAMAARHLASASPGSRAPSDSTQRPSGSSRVAGI